MRVCGAFGGLARTAALAAVLLVASAVRAQTSEHARVQVEAPVEEVIVQGARKEPATTAMPSAEAQEMPGAFGDPFRAIDIMPGVVPVVSGLPFFFVRGAPPGNTGYFPDGVRVPLVYHLAVGPSVVHPALIDHVDFYPGGYPARFGRFTGGIVDAETRGDAERTRFEGNLRLFDVGALAETQVDGGNGAALVAGRYGYPGLSTPGCSRGEANSSGS